jgi:hypothetical protein
VILGYLDILRMHGRRRKGGYVLLSFREMGAWVLVLIYKNIQKKTGKITCIILFESHVVWMS